MNWTIVRRLFWREFRTGRSFWIAVFLLSVGLQLAWLLANEFWDWHASRQAIWGISISMPLVYVLGWSATAFSREYETGSFEWLRVLPTRSSPIWLGKLGFTLVSSLLLGLALTVVTLVLGTVPTVLQKDLTSVLISLGVWLFWVLTVAGIGTFCSQWIKRPLTATFLAGTLLAVVAMWPTNRSLSMDDHIRWLNSGVLWFAGLAGLVASVPLTQPWLEDRMRRPLRPKRNIAIGHIAAPHAGGRLQAQLKRFVWITWKRLGVVGAITLLAVLLSTLFNHMFHHTIIEGVTPFILASWPVLLGVTLFYGEQDPVHARFLVGQGVSAGRIWWMRQLIGLAILIGVSLILAWILGWGRNYQLREFMHETRYGYWAYVVVAYAVGQMVSVTFRSTLVGMAMGALLGVATIGWTALFVSLRVPWLIGVAIPAAGCLLTSRTRVKSWLLQWNSLRNWIAPAAAFAGTIGLTYATFAVFRATEIPWFDPAFDVSAYTQEADANYNAAAANTIHHAADQLSSRPWKLPARYHDIPNLSEIRDEQDRRQLQRDREAQRERYFDEDVAVQQFGVESPYSPPTAHEGDDLRVSDPEPGSPPTVREEDGSRVTEWASMPLLIPAAEAEAVHDASDILVPKLEAAIKQAHGLWTSARWNYEMNRGGSDFEFNRLAKLFVARARTRERRSNNDLDSALADYQTALQLCQQMREHGRPVAWASADVCERVALDNLIFWAAAANQSPERVEAMTEWLVDYWRDQPAWVTPLKVDYITRSRFVEELPRSLDDLGVEGPEMVNIVYATLLLPGEKTRTRRWVNAQARDQFSRFGVKGFAGQDRGSVTRRIEEEWGRTTPLATVVDSKGEWLSASIPNLQASRGAALLRLLLIEHHLRFGEYPKPDDRFNLPDVIAGRARTLLDRARRAGDNDGEALPHIEGFSYGRLRPSAPEIFSSFSEPLGDLLVNAEGHLAVIFGETSYPLPVGVGGKDNAE